MITSSNFMASLAVLVLLLITSAKGDIMPPFLSPSFDICNDVECGKGNCSVDSGSLFDFRCACDNGWKHTPFGNETGLEFLPCIFPNCSINYSCMPAAAPAPAMSSNHSIFDLCYWIYCGKGTCTKNTTSSYTCQCDTDAYNLLNNPKFPCYSNCSLGIDCLNLGIGLSAPPPPSPPPPPPGSQVRASNPSQSPAPSSNMVMAASPSQSSVPSSNNAAELLPGKLHWIAVICVLMISSTNAMVLWN